MRSWATPALRLCLVSTLTACLVFPWLTLWAVISRIGDCGASDPYLLPECRVTLGHIVAPTSLNFLLVLLCGGAAAAGYAGLGITSAWWPEVMRRRRFVEPLLVVAALCLATASLAPVERNIGPLLLVAPLYWAAWALSRVVGRGLVGLDSYRPGNEPGVEPRSRVVVPVLLGSVLTFVGAGGVIYFASNPDFPQVSASMANTCTAVYLAAALVLLTHTSYAQLRLEWRGRHRSVMPRMVGSWIRYGLLSAGVLALAGLGIAIALGHEAQPAITLVVDLAAAGIGLLSSVGSFVPHPQNRWGSGFNPFLHGQPPTHLSVKATHLVHHVFPHANLGAQIIHDILLLSPIVVLLVDIAHRRVWAVVRRGTAALFTSAVVRAVRRLVMRLTRRLRLVLEPIADRVAGTILDPNGLGPRKGMGWLVRSGDRSSRERVRRAYLNAVQYAHSHDIIRRPFYTPEEFRAVLLQRLATGHDSVALLTDAFIEARYSNHPIGPDQARVAHGAFRAMRQAVRTAGNGPPDPQSDSADHAP